MNLSNNTLSLQIKGWGVHFLTASGAFACLLALYCIHIQEWILAFWALTICLFLDSIDGTLARKFEVKKNIPNIDGALLDNLVDYLSYVIAPTFFIVTYELAPYGWNFLSALFVIIASSYQFTQIDAKTHDNFFKGFPCYWNFVVFYLFIIDWSREFNLFILIFFSILVFVPIKYIYLSRMSSYNKITRLLICIATVIYGILSFILLLCYPYTNIFIITYTTIYISGYFIFSMYNTIYPQLKTNG